MLRAEFFCGNFMKKRTSKQDVGSKSKKKGVSVVVNNLDSNDKKDTLFRIFGKELFIFLNVNRERSEV